MKKFQCEYEVHYYEVDKNLNCTITSIMNYFLDAGNKQSESLKVGLEYLKSKNLTWVFYKYDIKVHRYPRYGEKITVSTVGKEFKKFYALRGYEIYDENNNKIVEGEAIFLLIDFEKRRAVRIPEDQYEAYGIDKNSAGKNLMERLQRLEEVKEEQFNCKFKVRSSEIDSNEHVDNVNYVKWAIDTMPQQVLDNYQLKEISIVFEKECYQNDEIKSVCEIKENEKEEIIVLHNIQNSEGKVITKMVSKWNKLKP